MMTLEKFFEEKNDNWDFGFDNLTEVEQNELKAEILQEARIFRKAIADKESIYKELGAYKSTSPFRSITFKPVMNHSVTFFENGKMLSSYGVNVAVIFNDGNIFLDPKHDYSNTTSKYVGQFTGLNLKARTKEIESGKIEVVELN